MRSPDTAPPRPDLGWLRHRRVAPPQVQQHHIQYVHAPRHPHSGSTPTAAGPEAPSLDLAARAVAPLLDLAPEAARPATPRRSRQRTLPYPRVQPGATLVLSAGRPTVTLTRLQSGVGQLRMTLTAGDGAGDLAPGLVCETADGATYVVQGDVHATPATPAPLVRRSTDGAFSVDLRQVLRLRRALLYGYSPSRAVLTWAGAVVTTTHDGSRVEAAFALPPLSGTVALMTVYNVHGELVLRSELEPFAGPPQLAGEAYGYHAGWLPGR